jgi:hypothetical protein
MQVNNQKACRNPKVDIGQEQQQACIVYWVSDLTKKKGLITESQMGLTLNWNNLFLSSESDIRIRSVLFLPKLLT